MRVLRLDLIAYGPFTNAVLDFRESGLHIVYGPNEAGKSTALRALRHLLYGIPERSTDAFRHPFPKLRIGGLLQSPDGRTLEIVRRKGRSGTLRRPDDTPVAEEELASFLNGSDARFFNTMFGIGYEDLVAGGSDIVRGGGDLGRLLFAAGTGSAPLTRVLGELQAESAALFLPAGQKPQINEALGRLKQLRGELAEAQLTGADWARHERELGLALHAKEDVERAIVAAQTGLHRIERFAQAQPAIAARRESLKGLEAVRDAVLVPEDFGDRRSHAVMRLRIAENERDQADGALSSVRAALAGLGDFRPVLAHAEAIEDVHQELGSQRKAARDRVGLDTRCSTHRTEARRILASLRKDVALQDCERLRVRKAEAVRIQELGGEYERLVGRIESTRARLPELQARSHAVEAMIVQIPAARPVFELKERLSECEPALAAARQLEATRAEAESRMRGCIDAAAKLGLTVSELRELSRLPVPGDDTITVFQERFERIEQRITALDSEIRQNRSDALDIERRLEEVRLEREVPSEEDLTAARLAREAVWREIRRRMEGLSQAVENAADVANGYEAAVRAADHLADRLRREADRVGANARLTSELSAVLAQGEDLRREHTELEDRLRAVIRDWEAHWDPIHVRPGRPREMQRWAGEYALLLARTVQALEEGARCDRMQSDVLTASRSMQLVLSELGEPCPDEGILDLARRARSIVASEEEADRRRAELERERLRLGGELQAAESRLQADHADLRRWQAEWAAAVEPLGMGSDARPAQAGVVMEELNRLFDHLKEADILQQRLDGIDRDAAAFRDKVQRLSAAVDVDPAGGQAEAVALELQRRLTAAREAQSRRQALLRQAEDAETRSKTAQATIAEVGAILQALCSEAGCASPADLPAAEHRSAERRRLEARLATESERLLQLCGGAALEDFIREASALDPDAIETEAARLREDIRHLGARKSELDQHIGIERGELNRMDGSDRAARLAEDVQAVIGGLEHDIERYARLRVAAAVLGRAIERFRERNQGPILRRACEMFKTLTCGSFEGLRAEHVDDRPVIVGLRPGGENVPVEGMSEGTADQLYLALRLSGLEHYLDREPAMPFIVDDLLIKFDDERAAAALETLSELAARTQVIFFTHHRHLLDIASAALPPASTCVHRLAPT
jgi:uncharacterized protein YhaN